MLRWRTPSPPSCAMTIAMSASVTVSIAEDRIGMLRSISLVTRVLVSAWLGSTLDSAGWSSTSSKVRPSGMSIMRLLGESVPSYRKRAGAALGRALTVTTGAAEGAGMRPRPLVLALLLLAPAGCRARAPAPPPSRLILWAWERPEDLRFVGRQAEVAVQTGFIAISAEGLTIR